MAGPDRMPAVTLEGGYFATEKRRFLVVGAHWVPAEAAMQWPQAFDEAELEADFAKMNELGFNLVRFDLLWAWFEPHPGDFSKEAFRQFDCFIDLAHRYQIYLHPVLFVGGEVGEAFWDVPWRAGRHPHADPEMLRLQTEHAAEFARRYRGETAILAWDLTDEPPFWIVADRTTDAMAVNWTRLVAGALRRDDPEHLICIGTSMEDLTHGPFRPDLIASEVDFLSVHPYPIYAPQLFPDAMLSERSSYCGSFQVALSSGTGKSVMVQEFGASSAQYSPERIARCDQVTLYSSLAAGANGFAAWCFTDASPDAYRRAPYLRAPHETQFGLTTHDRRDRPRAKSLQAFSRIAALLDLRGIQPAPSEAAIIVPHEWAAAQGDFSRLGLQGAVGIDYVSNQMGQDSGSSNQWLMGALLSSYILSRRSGLKASLPREYGSWQDHPLVMLPSPLTSTSVNLVHVHTGFWETALQYVQAGGTLYASLCADAAIPAMSQLFGARLVDHFPVESPTLTVIEPLGDLSPGTTFHYRADPANQHHWPVQLELAGARVIAEDQDGRPAIVAHSLGKGKVLLSAYPLEHYLAVCPAAFDRPENTHLLYRGLWQWAGLEPCFQTDQPSVEAGGLIGRDRGYTVLVNHSLQACTATITARFPLGSAAQVSPSGWEILALNGNQWKVELEGCSGAIVEWTL